MIIGVRYSLIIGELIGLERLRSTQFLPAEVIIEEKNSLNQIKKIAWIAPFIQLRNVLHACMVSLAVYVLEFESNRCRRRRLVWTKNLLTKVSILMIPNCFDLKEVTNSSSSRYHSNLQDTFAYYHVIWSLIHSNNKCKCLINKYKQKIHGKNSFAEVLKFS